MAGVSKNLLQVIKIERAFGKCNLKSFRKTLLASIDHELYEKAMELIQSGQGLFSLMYAP